MLTLVTSNPVIEDLVNELTARLDVLLAVSHATPEQDVWQLDAALTDLTTEPWVSKVGPRLGSPLSGAVSDSGIVNRPLVECPRRTHEYAQVT